MNLTDKITTKRILVDGSTYSVAAGTSVLTSSVIDTLGYEGVRIILGVGAITANAVTSFKLQQSSDDGSADAYSDIEGSSVTIADDDDNQVVVSDVWRPQKRYLKVVTTRGTQNAVVDFLLAELYEPRVLPATTSHATVVATEKFASPDEGTA